MHTHADRKPHLCPVQGCERDFLTLYQMKKHYRNIHDTGRKKHACDLCDKSFSKRTELRNHKSIDHGEIEFLCRFDSCGRSFPCRAKLDNHMQIHTGFKCVVSGCSSILTSRNELKIHYRTIHNDICGLQTEKKVTSEPPSFSDADDTSISPSETFKISDIKVFQCPKENCLKKYSQERNLVSHLRRIHGDEFQFACPDESCKKLFRYKNVLKRHMERGHVPKNKLVTEISGDDSLWNKIVRDPQKSSTIKLINPCRKRTRNVTLESH